MAELHGLSIVGLLTTYIHWNDPPSIYIYIWKFTINLTLIYDHQVSMTPWKIEMVNLPPAEIAGQT